MVPQLGSRSRCRKTVRSPHRPRLLEDLRLVRCGVRARLAATGGDEERGGDGREPEQARCGALRVRPAAIGFDVHRCTVLSRRRHVADGGRRVTPSTKSALALKAARPSRAGFVACLVCNQAGGCSSSEPRMRCASAASPGRTRTLTTDSPSTGMAPPSMSSSNDASMPYARSLASATSPRHVCRTMQRRWGLRGLRPVDPCRHYTDSTPSAGGGVTSWTTARVRCR